MPTYDYECDHCGTMEVFHSIKAEALTNCPECGRDGLRRLLSSGAGVIFKGSGFWETDYNRSCEYQNQAKGEAGTGAAGKSEAKTGADAGSTQSPSPASPAKPTPTPPPSATTSDPAAA